MAEGQQAELGEGRGARRVLGCGLVWILDAMNPNVPGA
jgi:hypothetical protein